MMIITVAFAPYEAIVSQFIWIFKREVKFDEKFYYKLRGG